MGDELRTLTGRYETDTSMLEKQIRLGASFDLLGRKFLVGGQKATLYFVDGFAKDEVMEKILEYLMKLTPEEIPVILDSGNRTLAGPTAPPGGLYLTRVWYEDERLNGPDGI